MPCCSIGNHANNSLLTFTESSSPVFLELYGERTFISFEASSQCDGANKDKQCLALAKGAPSTVGELAARRSTLEAATEGVPQQPR